MILTPCLASKTFHAPAHSPVSQSCAVAPSHAYSAFQPDWDNTLSFPASSSVITWLPAGCLPIPHPFTSPLAKLSLFVVRLKCRLLQESSALLWGPVVGSASAREMLYCLPLPAKCSPDFIASYRVCTTFLACIPGPRFVGKSGVCQILYTIFLPSTVFSSQ